MMKSNNWRVMMAMAMGAAWSALAAPESHEYKLQFIPKTDTPPVIDGKADDAIWKKSPVITDFGPATWNRDVDSFIPRTEARLLWDDQYLYLLLTCYEDTPENMESFKRVIQDRSLAWHDRDIVEFHVNGPNPGNVPKHQFAMNVIDNEKICNKYFDGGWGMIVDSNYGRVCDWEKRSFIGKDFWQVEARFRLADLSISEPKVGFRLGFNVGRFRFKKTYYHRVDHSILSFANAQIFCWANRELSHHETVHGRGIFVNDVPKTVFEGIKLSYPDLAKQRILVQTDDHYLVVENGKESEMTYLEAAKQMVAKAEAAAAKYFSITNGVTEPKPNYFRDLINRVGGEIAKVKAKREELEKLKDFDVGELNGLKKATDGWAGKFEQNYWNEVLRLLLTEEKVRTPVVPVAKPDAPSLYGDDTWEGVMHKPWKRQLDGIVWARPLAAGRRKVLITVSGNDAIVAWELKHRLDIDADIFESGAQRWGSLRDGDSEYKLSAAQKADQLEAALARGRYDAFVFLGVTPGIWPVRMQCYLVERMLKGACVFSSSGSDWLPKRKQYDATIVDGLPKPLTKLDCPEGALLCDYVTMDATLPGVSVCQVGKGQYAAYKPESSKIAGMSWHQTAFSPSWWQRPCDMIIDEYCYAHGIRAVMQGLRLNAGRHVRSVTVEPAEPGEPLNVTVATFGDTAFAGTLALVVRDTWGKMVGEPIFKDVYFTTGENHVSMTLGGQPFGRYTVEATLLNGQPRYDGVRFSNGAVYDFAAGWANVRPCAGERCRCNPLCAAKLPLPGIEAILPGQRPFGRRDAITANVTVKNAVKGLFIEAALRDPRLRIIEKGRFPVDPATGKALVKFPAGRLVENCHFIVAELKNETTTYDRMEREIFRRLGLREEYTVFTDGWTAGGRSLLDHMALTEYYGINLWQGGSPTRVFFGGDDAARNRYGWESDESGSTVSSKWYMERMKRLYAATAKTIAQRNGAFISVGDDSAAPSKMRNTIPEWLTPFFDLVQAELERKEKYMTRWGRDKVIAQWVKDRKIPLQTGNHYYWGFLKNIRSVDGLKLLAQAEMQPGDELLLREAAKTGCVTVENFNRQTGTNLKSFDEISLETFKQIKQPCSSQFVVFQFWLRDKYKTVEALNKNWETQLKDFFGWNEDVLLSQQQKGNQAPNLDWKRYLIDLGVKEFRELERTVHAQSYSTKIFMGASEFGNAFEACMPIMRSYCPYWGKDNEIEIGRVLDCDIRGEVVGSYNAWNTETPLRELEAWHPLLTGCNFSWFWTSMYTVRGDLGLREGYGGSCMRAYREMKRGPASLVLRSQRQNDGVRILASTLSGCLGGHWGARHTLQSYLENSGFQYDYVWGFQLPKLAAEKAKVLFLPSAVCLTEAEIREIRKFAERGGLLIANEPPAKFDENGHVRKDAPLADLFASGKGVMLESQLDDIALHLRTGKGAADVAKLRELLAKVGVAPIAKCVKADGQELGGTEFTRFRRGSMELLGFEKRRLVGEKLPVKTELVLPEKLYTWNVRQSKRLGLTDKLPYEVKGFEVGFYSRFPYDVKGLKLQAPKAVVRGETLKFTAALDVASLPKDAKVATHVFRVELLPPGGERVEKLSPIPYRLVDAPQGQAQVGIAIAYNEPYDNYTLVVTDVATGLSSKQELSITAK